SFLREGKEGTLRKESRTILPRAAFQAHRQAGSVQATPLAFSNVCTHIFDAPSFDAEFVKLLKGQAICAAAVKQLIGRLRTPNGPNQLNEIFCIEGGLENVFIAPIIRIFLEIAVGERSFAVSRDIHADLIREFALAHLSN